MPRLMWWTAQFLAWLTCGLRFPFAHPSEPAEPVQVVVALPAPLTPMQTEFEKFRQVRPDLSEDEIADLVYRRQGLSARDLLHVKHSFE